MEQKPASIQTCQIIAAALIMGVVTITGVFLGMNLTQEKKVEEAGDQAEGISVLVIAATCLAAGALMGRSVVLGSMDRAAQTDSEEENTIDPLQSDELLGQYQTRTIISMALPEGAAFFGAIAFYIEGRWEGLGITLFMLIVMAMSFPTENKYLSWVESLGYRREFE